MLDVLNAGSTELSRAGDDRGIFLNCLNKSSPLIKELERTVNFAERKCGDLMQELHFYKEYYKKWAQVDHVPLFTHKKKLKKCCRETPDFGSSSENELERANEYFCKKIKSKIREMSNEIALTSENMHSTEPSSGDVAGPPSLILENKTCKSEPVMTPCEAAEGDAVLINVTGKQSSKSVPARAKMTKHLKRDLRPSRKRSVNLQRFKIRAKSLPRGVRRKFGFGGFYEVLEPDAIKSRSRSRTSLKAESSNVCESLKSRTKLVEARKLTPQSSRGGAGGSKSDVRQCHNSKTKFHPDSKNGDRLQKKSAHSEKAAANTCTAIVPSGSVTEGTKENLDPTKHLKTLIAKPNTLLPFLRNPIPFIPCSSTSKTFNLGLNVQQVLSLLKRKRHSVTLQAIVRNGMRAARSVTEPHVDALFINQTSVGQSRVTSSICPAREGSEDGFSVVTNDRSKCSILKRVQTLRSQVAEEKNISQREFAIETDKLERPEDVWAVEQPDAASKEAGNSRSRCTCFPSKHCVDYNKVLRQYTGWSLPPEPRSESLCIFPSDVRVNCGRTDLVKVHSDLLNLTRKCSYLQERISQNCLNDFEAIAELDAMESELTVREIEFKDILNFYDQLIILKGKLKSLRTRVRQNESSARRPECQRPRKDPLRPTPSMALAKVLKKIQGLQDKIKLVYAP